MEANLLLIPGPVTVAPAVLSAMSRQMIDHRSAEYARLLERISTGMQPLFGTPSEVLVLGASGSGGLEAAIANAVSPGDTVLAAPVGVFGQRLINMARTHGATVEVLETPLGHRVDAAALAARLKADTAHEISTILLTHNETSTGVQNDMAELSAAIGDHPALRIVDSVSGLGASEFKMDEWGFDIVITASQKALAVPPGLAMVAVSPRGWERIEKTTSPRFYFDLIKARDFAKLGQTPWTPPVSIAYALDVGLSAFEAEGAPNVWARHERYAKAYRAAAAAIGVEVFSQPDAHSVTVVALKVPAGLEADAIRRALRERFGISIGGGQQELKGKVVRLGTMGALEKADILRAIGALETVLSELGQPLGRGSGIAAAQDALAERETSVV
jgi:aspartate aminotransferase-like enzyme